MQGPPPQKKPCITYLYHAYIYVATQHLFCQSWMQRQESLKIVIYES